MDGYYTPELSEFHVGFEYEAEDFVRYDEDYKVPVYGFMPVVFHPEVDKFEGVGDETWCVGDIKGIQKDIDNGNIRVKHLDRSDIESLGWTLQHSENTMWDYYEKEGTDMVLYHDKKDLITNGVWIKWMNYNNSEWHPTCYKLKNKSELSKLMKQLGI